MGGQWAQQRPWASKCPAAAKLYHMLMQMVTAGNRLTCPNALHLGPDGKAHLLQCTQQAHLHGGKRGVWTVESKHS